MDRKHGLLPGFLLLIALCLVVSGCGGSGGDEPGYEATIAGTAGTSGKLSVTIASGAAGSQVASRVAGDGQQAATGTVRLVGNGSFDLAGAYDPSAGTLALAGGGYTIAGTIAGGEVNGTFTGPGGVSGLVAGLNGSGGGPRVFCGTYSGTRTVVPFAVQGVFNIVIGGDGRITGLGVDDLGKGGRVTGALKGSAITASTDGGTSIAGTLSGDNVSGTFSEPQSSGTWSGTRI